MSALSNPSEGVRVAACTCIKSISRSVKVRRYFHCNAVFKFVFLSMAFSLYKFPLLFHLYFFYIFLNPELIFFFSSTLFFL